MVNIDALKTTLKKYKNLFIVILAFFLGGLFFSNNSQEEIVLDTTGGINETEVSSPLAVNELVDPSAEATKGTVISIADGDTITVSVDGNNMKVRLIGIDTPEMRDKDPEVRALARSARERTLCLLSSARRILLKDVRRGKYFRIIADVYIDGVNLGDILITEDLAKPYDGGKRPDWSNP